MEMITFIGFIVIAVVAFFVGNHFSLNQVAKKNIEQALKDKSSELETLHYQVNQHFEKTADLFNDVSESYQSLYEHLSQSSNTLGASKIFQKLPKMNEFNQKVTSTPEHSESSISKEKNNELKKENNEVFDADKLYNAHDYLNHSEVEQKKETSPLEQGHNVVKLNPSKEEKALTDQQALDYALKNKELSQEESEKIQNQS
jgi:uncharacterized membrane-anchored protein YhcB (DUF1043 family)